jgi:hypothetical protein
MRSGARTEKIPAIIKRPRIVPYLAKGSARNGWVPVLAREQNIRTEARRGFQKHVVRFSRLQHLQTWEKNQVRPEVVLVNSHDTSSAGQHSLNEKKNAPELITTRFM